MWTTSSWLFCRKWSHYHHYVRLNSRCLLWSDCIFIFKLWEGALLQYFSLNYVEIIFPWIFIAGGLRPLLSLKQIQTSESFVVINLNTTRKSFELWKMWTLEVTRQIEREGILIVCVLVFRSALEVNTRYSDGGRCLAGLSKMTREWQFNANIVMTIQLQPSMMASHTTHMNVWTYVIVIRTTKWQTPSTWYVQNLSGVY